MDPKDSSFVPAIWADEIMRRFTGKIDRGILEAAEGGLWEQVWENMGMKIDPSLEAFFVAIALEHGTHPEPKFGIERNNLAREITVILSNHKGAPDVLQKVRRNYRELGGKLLDTDPQWFYSKLAHAYLTWLYEQEESKALLPEVLAKMDNDVAQRARQAQGMKTRMRAFKL